MRKLLLLILALSGGPAFAGSATTSAVPFLRLPVGARAVAMGEAFTSAADDATALYWNPALLASTDGNSASLMHASYLAGTGYDFAAVNLRKNKSGMAFGIQRFSSGNMTEYDASGADAGGFEPSDMAVVLGYGLEFYRGYCAGVATKYIHSSIITSAHSYAVDLGAATPYYGGRLRLAAVLANLGDTIRYDNAEENLPLLLRLGASYRLLPKVLLTGEVGLPRAGNNYLAAGMEYVEEIGRVNVSGRLGYNTRTIGDVPGFSGLSAGVGIGFSRMSADYALSFLGDLGSAHRFSLSFRFGG